MTGNANQIEANGVTNSSDIVTIIDGDKEVIVLGQRNENAKIKEMEKDGERVIVIDDMMEDSDDDGWDDEDKEYSWSETNPISYGVKMFQNVVITSFRKVKSFSRGYFWQSLFLALYAAYFVYAMYKTFDVDNADSLRLLICTILGIIIATRHRVSSATVKLYRRIIGPDGLNERQKRILFLFRFISRWFLYAALCAFIVWILVDEAMDNPDNLIGLPGLVIMIFLCILMSSNPGLINWHTIVWSIGLQFIFAVFTLRFQFGRDAVIWVQDRLDEFFDVSVGAFVFMFGQNYLSLGTAFGALPLIFMMTATLALLHYIGAMQLIIKVLGQFFSFVMDVHHVEALSVSGGIFVDSLLALVAVRPYLGTATKSELFTIITSIYASLGGAFLAILKGIGVPLRHIIPAMVISAPATFLVCKVIVPENRPKRKVGKAEEIETDTATNALDVYQFGAISGLAFAGNIVAVTFAFLCALEWIDRTLTWFGEQVDVADVTMQWIFSYLLYPISLGMGVHPDDCRTVAKMLGIRLVAGNFIAFTELQALSRNRDKYEEYMSATNNTGIITHDSDDIYLGTVADGEFLEGGLISRRSEVIATYSLCGFSSLVSLGFVMASIYAFIPHRRPWLSRMAIPALIAGNIANCMTGCFASLFYET